MEVFGRKSGIPSESGENGEATQEPSMCWGVGKLDDYYRDFRGKL